MNSVYATGVKLKENFTMVGLQMEGMTTDIAVAPRAR